MNPDLKKLYQETLLSHSKQPHNNHELPEAEKTTIRNPLCGDEITVYRKNGDITFTAQACTICLASASMMTQHLATLPTPEAAAFADSLVSRLKEKPETIDLPGDLAALSGVLSFPSRIRCATLPFEAYLSLDSSK
ncbi:iron-sulfur cluster assembly scaffold protein [Pelagicoccus mobilis]|uniref:Iron-sulfur cluster assembly scaffold protein n=1 Tax=Pelagicoccus mobilis TaxID=415221 RepID=A0A934VS76_9BACT|nr:iron-sulfur cluster assembly scaffold protein [Pelagicoccus mobilis]MBK1880147.1 iron-sulfur cluster assembly scaffold protein [Pelagicoccus mobilis]